MIPVLQFDPASLTLWYDAQLISQCRGHRELGLSMEYAITGNDPGLQRLIPLIGDPWVQTRAASIASAVWHEKRHFLDFVLTNYGALRVRQFFEMYANTPAVFNMWSQTQRLLVPLDSNLDPISRQIAGIGALDENFERVARAVADRKEMMNDDRRPLPSRFGTIEVGGEAILEAIAYHLQHAKTHRVLGGDLNARVQKDHPGETVIHQKYKWAYEILMRAHLLEVDEVRDGVLRISDAPFVPFCYGALAGRFWKQQQTRGEFVSSHLPGERFASLATAIAATHPEFRRASVTDAWDIVNATCRELFGRTVIEETEADFAAEEKFVEYLRTHQEGEQITRAYADLHQLRGKLIALLKTEPELFLDQAVWADKMVNRTQPAIVVAAPAGEIGEPPAGYNRLAGYSHPDTDFSQVPEGRWWWAAFNKKWPDPHNDPDALCVTELEAWSYIAAEYAPFAKLMYAGHNVRVMLGPELFAARVRFQQQTGLKMVVDPAFAYPKAQHDVAYWYFITGHDDFRCDLSSETVQKPEGYMIDPWELRLRPGVHDALLGTVADQRSMRFTFWRDWSPWLLSEEFREFFESFAADEERLYQLLS